MTNVRGSAGPNMFLAGSNMPLTGSKIPLLSLIYPCRTLVWTYANFWATNVQKSNAE